LANDADEDKSSASFLIRREAPETVTVPSVPNIVLPNKKYCSERERERERSYLPLVSLVLISLIS